MRRWIFSLCLCCLASHARGALVMDGWSHYLQPDTVTRVPLLAYGDEGDTVLAMDLYVQIDDGGSAPPIITNLDVSASDTLFSNPSYPPFYDVADPRTWMGIVVSDPRLPVRHNVIAWLTIDTTGVQVGQSYLLRLQDILPEVIPGGFDSDFGLDPVTVQDGVIHIVSRQTLHWYGEDGNWDDAKWAGGSAVYPTADMDAIIDGPHTVTANSAVECTNLSMSNGAILNAPSITAESLSIGGSGFVAAVPEPSTVVLLAAAAIASCAAFLKNSGQLAKINS